MDDFTKMLLMKHQKRFEVFYRSSEQQKQQVDLSPINDKTMFDQSTLPLELFDQSPNKQESQVIEPEPIETENLKSVINQLDLNKDLELDEVEQSADLVVETVNEFEQLNEEHDIPHNIQINPVLSMIKESNES